MGGEGQERICQARILLHGEAPLCATYLAAAGLGCLLHTGEPPELSAHDPRFEMRAAAPGDDADLVLDLGDGAALRAAAGPALWGAAHGSRVLLDADPVEGQAPASAARAVMETLAACEALRRLMGHAPNRYEFTVG